ncbi:hypothetical protein VTK56DRAFT_9465 [Thermocarpiscus australiensis]
MECRGRVAMARLDPLMSPNTPSQHAHTIHGSSGMSETATYEDLRNAGCTSCAAVQDHSAYWTPSLYFRHANGTYQEVEQVGGMLAYYTLEKDAGNPDAGIKAFPNDFRMIAGDSTRRNYSVASLSYLDPDPPKSNWASLGQTDQNDLAQRAIGFNCLNYQKDPEGAFQRHYLPEKAYLDANCTDGVRFEIMFPSCWNGKDIESPDHKSHVAYPDLITTGTCPKGFDVKLPGLMYETIWATNEFAGVPGEFVISNGDVQGFGYHGDFISGWDSNFLQAAVDQCTNGSGKVSDCPLFTLQSEDEQRQCKLKLPTMLADEKTTGIIGDSLPGGVLIQYGPEPATINVPASQPTTAPVSSVGSSAAITVSSSHLPGGVFKETATSSAEISPPSSTSTAEFNALAEPPSTSTAEFNALAQPSSTSTAEVNALAQPSPTPTPTPSDPPVPEGYEIVRTDYVTNGNTVSKIVVIETVEYVMVATETVTVTATFGADKVRRALHHIHRHRNGAH